MPELPEVETVRRQLDERLRGRRIDRVKMLQTGREEPAGKAFVKALEGAWIRTIARRAKLLVWHLEDSRAILAHLKMTGRFVFVDADYVPTKHDRIEFQLGEDRLMWGDVRKFGFMKIADAHELEDILGAYGPEPLETSAKDIAARFSGSSTRPIKTALLDQAILAGVGNIYADEALHRAGIRPIRRLSSLSEKERLARAASIQEILQESIAQQGTSANDYVDTKGERGGFLDLLRVYQRGGEPCTTCKTPIKRIVLAQRGTHYCPTCQK